MTVVAPRLWSAWLALVNPTEWLNPITECKTSARSHNSADVERGERAGICRHVPVSAERHENLRRFTSPVFDSAQKPFHLSVT